MGLSDAPSLQPTRTYQRMPAERAALDVRSSVEIRNAKVVNAVVVSMKRTK